MVWGIISRLDGSDRILSLSDFTMQESSSRLAFWGLDVEIAVPDRESEAAWQFFTLRQLRPFYWNDEIR
jgi:hypothetical protein